MRPLGSLTDQSKQIVQFKNITARLEYAKHNSMDLIISILKKLKTKVYNFSNCTKYMLGVENIISALYL